MPIRVALVVPHIFMHRELLPQVIFSPGQLALQLADGLVALGCEVTLYTPGPVATKAINRTADLTLFERELAIRGDSYLSLLKKHPFTFVTLARQVQSEIIAEAFSAANSGEHDLVHIYTNEEDTALPFAALCTKPVVFTHHDPYNFMVKYKSVMPKYKHVNWVSISEAQRTGMPPDTHWVGNVYHGVNQAEFTPLAQPTRDYFAYFGRIIEQKGVHLAIDAVREYNQTADKPLKLKIAGKHYSESEKKSYWEQRIEPKLDASVEYVGFLDAPADKRAFLGNAAALIVPSIFDEPFGMVAIEALACGTPVVALDSGALPEVIEHGKTGYIAAKVFHDKLLDESATSYTLATDLANWQNIDPAICYQAYQQRFTTARMATEYAQIYQDLLNQH